jgi:hypothetical protein
VIVGFAVTLTATVWELLQPPEVPVTVYVVFVDGFRLMVFVVAFVLQL